MCAISICFYSFYASSFIRPAGVFRSWENKKTDPADGVKVIIDDTVNVLAMMFMASALPGGNPKWYNMSFSHALQAAKNHVRKDGTTFHVVTYNSNTGKVMKRGTHQGFSDSRTWTRGQAWAIYGFTYTAQYTGNQVLLETAKRVSDAFLKSLPADNVPLWDFNAPKNIAYKDTSASAIAAAGLFHLAKLTNNEEYSNAATKILTSLATQWTSKTAPWTPKPWSILRNGTSNYPRNEYAQGLVYGDYYVLEALHELLSM